MVRLRRPGLRAKHRPDPSGETRHLGQREGESVLGELVVVPAIELAPCGNCAHLVVELGPTDVASVVAETDELHDVCGRSLPGGVGC